MANIPAVAAKRLTASVPKFRKILGRAKERDVNESDTVTIITDMLEEVFGFDKYSDITREFGIQGTYCDLAIKTGKRIQYLIEVKAIGLELRESHLRQSVNYASREGVKWVVLTNGINWEIHRVHVDEKVQSERLFAFNILEMNPRKKEDQDLLFLLCKRGVQKDLIADFYEYKQSVNRYTIGALLLSDPILTVVRRELRRLKTGLNVDVEEIGEMMAAEVLKRDLIEGEAAKEAQKQVTKAMKLHEKAKTKAKPKPSQDSQEGS